MIGDADLRLLLGEGPFAESYPIMDLTFGSQPRRSDRSGWRILVCKEGLDASCQVPKSTHMSARNAPRLPLFYRSGETPVWAGTDSDGAVMALVVDHLSGLINAEALPRVDDVVA